MTESQNDPNDRLRVGGWLPSRNDSTATQQIAAVPAEPPVPAPASTPTAPPALEPVHVERQRRGRRWFLVVPVAMVVLVVAVAWAFRPDDAEIGPDLAQQSPRVALPVISASATPSPKPSAGSTSTGASASTRPLPTPTASATPTASGTPTAPAAHRGAVVGIGGRCLAADRDRPELAVCADRSSQQWSAPGDGTVRVSNRCLDVFASGEANGTPVILYQCNRTDAQQWQIRGDGTWRNPQSNKCLGTVGGRSDPGTRLAVFDCAGGASQKWTMN